MALIALVGSFGGVAAAERLGRGQAMASEEQRKVPTPTNLPIGSTIS
jgi:hypothetical protein